MTGISPYLKSFGKQTLCFCPLCERDHHVNMEWAGNDVPRIHCKPCKKSIERGSEMDLNSKKPNDPYPEKSGKNIFIRNVKTMGV